MPSPVATTLDVLLLAVEQQLLSNGYTASNCFISLRPDDVITPGSDVIAVITPGDEDVDEGIDLGSGTVCVYFKGDFTVTLKVRLALDQTPRDDSWFTDPSLGAIQATTSLIKLLHYFQPEDSSGNQLVAVPIKLKRKGHYSREMKGVGWGFVKLTFALEYQHAF